MMIFGKLVQRHEQRIKAFLERIGYDYRHWTRPVMYETCFEKIQTMEPGKMDALEISAGEYWRYLPFRTFTEANYPEFDITKDKLDRQFDIIIADQVFEHVLFPYKAAKNVYDMLRPGGYFVITTPFLIRVHEIPYDCTRWTETGMRYFLHECGFSLDRIETSSWGNKSCVKANLKRWARRGWFGSLKNEPNYPVVVWAFARK